MMVHGGVPTLVAEGISKHFGGVHALRGITFDVHAGEVHGLIGANGAGKSTLISVLSGAIAPDAGTLRLGSHAVPLGSVAAARQAGIAVVHQELMLFPDRSVEENVAASALPVLGWGVRDLGRQRRSVGSVLASLSDAINPRARVGDLPLPQQQLVEIARALHGGGSVLILDEPTSALSQPEAERLFAVLRRVAAASTAIVFVSHRLDEVLSLTDRITVLRDGRVAARTRSRDADVGSITRAMVGEVEGLRHAHRARAPDLAPVLSLRGATAEGVGPVDVDLYPGDVLGLIGLEGSGVGPLLRLMGGDLRGRGEMRVAGAPVRFRHPADALALGVVYMPPDRKKGGLWLDRSAGWNIVAPAVSRMTALQWLSQQAFGRTASRRLADVGVRQSALGEPVVRLSGGNQQRVLLARSLELAPAVLLLSDFTRGVDVRAKADIQRLVRALAETKGVAICLSSSDVKEILEVADRVLFMRAGRIVAGGRAGEYDELRAMAMVSAPGEHAMPP